MQQSSLQTPKTMFSRATQLCQQGHLSQSKSLYETILQLHSTDTLSLIPSLHYDCLINLSTIYMQQNSLQEAKFVLRKAIVLNQYRYEAFYNFSIVNFLTKSLEKSLESLKLCLSFLYLDLGILTGSFKLLNTSISLYDKNYKAYIHRAIYYQNNNKIRHASNQFETLTQEHEQFQFSNQEMAEIYAQKAIFFRRIKSTQKIEENLIMYHKYRKEAIIEKNKSSEIITNLLSQVSDETALNEGDQTQMKEKIKSMVKQVQSLIEQIRQERIKQKQILKPRENIEIKALQQIHLSSEKSQDNIQQQTITKIKTQKKENFFDDQIQVPSKHQTPHVDQNPSISINEDEDSVILNQKIQELQRQIKASGGNVPEIKDVSQNSDAQNFLEFQIQKTMQEIEIKKKQEEKMKQNTQKLPDAGKSGISQSKISSSGDIRDSVSMRSKISQFYEIGMEEMKNYESFTLEIRSFTMFEQNSPRKESYAKVKYFEHEKMTEKCKTEKFNWNHTFDDIKIKHKSLEDEDDDDSKYELQIELFAKEGGWISWKNDVLLGKGEIKLRQKGTTKCTLENKGKKVGILYYKAKLNKFLGILAEN